MAALLDTHAFLWLVSDEDRLSPPAREFVKDTSNRLFLSIASGWEIAVKVARGRLETDVPLLELLTEVPQRFSIELLPIQPSHLVAVASLPDHHRDPFDRLLIAQALVEGLAMVSVDEAVDLYGVRRIW